MQSKRLSVIIPGYNNPELWWRRCLDSVIANLSQDDEVLCVDDGSSIRPTVLGEYARKDNRISVLYMTENRGLSAARNAALRVAQGEFVTFVDSDDEILPNTYPKALSTLIDSGFDIAIFGVRSIWVSEKLMKDNVPKQGVVGELSPEILNELYSNSLLNYAWNKIYRKSFLVSNNISFDQDGMPCEDIIFILNCVIAKARWAMLGHIGIKYYRTHGSLLSCYKKSYLKGTKLASLTWQRYKSSVPNAKQVLGSTGEVTEIDLIRGEWDNMWRLKSPYKIRDKWAFLKSHREISCSNPLVYMLRFMIYQFLRRHFYIKPIQRWHIRRVYSDAVPV